MTERSKAMLSILPRGARVLKSTPPLVVLSGISPRAGVGGRRGRKRRRAEERAKMSGPSLRQVIKNFQEGMRNGWGE